MAKVRRIDSNHRLAPAMPYILIASGIAGFISSFVLSYEDLQLIVNRDFMPACDVNPIISCGSVLHSAHGATFGFPNSWLGLAAFAVVITVGVGMLAGATFKRWFWLCFAGGIGLGLAFAYWLLWESVYQINALCPFCLGVDVVMTVIFWYLALYIVREQHLLVPRRLIGAADFARKYHFAILLTWVLAVIALIVHHFWYYYGQYI